MTVYTKVRDDIMSNETVRDRTVVDSRDGHGDVLENARERVALSERVGDTQRSCARVDQRERPDGLAVGERERDVDKEMVWMIGVSIRCENEKGSNVISVGYKLPVR